MTPAQWAQQHRRRTERLMALHGINPPRSVGAQLKTARLRRGLDLIAAGKVAGCSNAAISMYERDLRGNLPMIERIAGALGCEVVVEIRPKRHEGSH